MAAASSGDPGGSAARRLPTFMDPTNKFGELTFLQLAGKDGDRLPSNPYVVGKSVEMCVGGQIESGKREAQGTRYTLRVRDPTQVPKLLKMSQLIDGTKVEVIPHPNLNVCRCTIFCTDLIDMEEADILQEMKSDGVIRVQRITRNENGKRVNTPVLILTFCKTTYPEHLKVGLNSVPTRPFFPNPMLCYSCFSYGHTRARCPGPQRCFNCSGNVHEVDECNETPYCRNCKDGHRPTNRQCPVYKQEVEVIKIKVRDNLSFAEARKRAKLQSQGSYAQVAAQQNEIDKKLMELEAKMKQKDDLIAKLLEDNRRKDEKLEQMMIQMQELKHQIDSQEKPCHSKDLKPTYPTVGVVTRSRTNSPALTRSRNNSPAFQETKRGRTQKQNACSLTKQTISPDRQSPPPKKTATTTTKQQPTASDDDMEISESPPNRHLR